MEGRIELGVMDCFAHSKNVLIGQFIGLFAPTYIGFLLFLENSWNILFTPTFSLKSRQRKHIIKQRDDIHPNDCLVLNHLK